MRSREDAIRCLRLHLERDPQAPAVARAAVRGFIEESDITTVESTLALLVSELVSNAVRHSDAPPASSIVLRASFIDHCTIRIEVIDRGSGFNVMQPDRSAPSGGYGLFLVDIQATRWGVDRHGGTRVWFELSAPTRGRPGHTRGDAARPAARECLGGRW